jgi:oligopeptide/dipeptide ABC transporter ATP-binding protein
MSALVEIKNLKTYFESRGKGLFNKERIPVKAVDGVSFNIEEGETLGIVGESGCGKTTLGRTLIRLIEPTDGQILFKGEDIAHYSASQMRKIRSETQIIFQDPYSALNPRHTVGNIISTPFEIQGVEPEGGVKREVQRLMERVGLNPEHFNRYPHEFSGGQRQRIGIARAIALKPKFIVADEPVSALDVSIQSQIINLLDDLKSESGITFAFIAHDLSVIQHISDRVVVMYLGKVMEISDSTNLYLQPKHPYTKALLSAVPQADPKVEKSRERIILQGDLPSPSNPPSGCVFRTRCWKAADICSSKVPELLQVGASQVACHFPE